MRGRGQGENMKDYNFEVLKDGAVVVSSHSIPLPDLAAAWSKIAHLAGTVEGPGY
jgi:hypothetical protein